MSRDEPYLLEGDYFEHGFLHGLSHATSVLSMRLFPPFIFLSSISLKLCSHETQSVTSRLMSAPQQYKQTGILQSLGEGNHQEASLKLDPSIISKPCSQTFPDHSSNASLTLGEIVVLCYAASELGSHWCTYQHETRHR